MIAKTTGMYRGMAESVPQFRRGKVWCTICGRAENVNAASALQNGWPKCCGFTMTIDSPDERRALLSKKELP